MFRSVRVLAFIFATLGLCGSASAEWRGVSSEHFSVAGDATPAELKAIAKRLELSRIVISRILPWLTVDGGHQLRVIVFADAAEYRGFKPKRADGTPDDAVAGYYLRGDTRDLITLAADSNDAATVAHEYVHYVLRSTFRAPAKLPAWLDEGLAQYFQSFRSNPDGTVTLGLEPLNRLAAIRKGGSTVPKDLFAAERAMTTGAEEQRASFYSWAWAAVHYMMSGPEASEKLRRLITGEDTPDANAVSQLQRYVSWGIVSSSTIDLGSLAVSEPEISALDAARSDCLLGELLIRLGRSADAETYLRRALASDNGVGEAHSLLGAVLAQRGNFEEAKKELGFATEHGVDDVSTLFFKAYATTRAGAGIADLDETAVTEVRSALERAVTRAPDLADAAQLLALVYVSTDTNLPDAVALLQRAATLKPGDESLQLLLARALLRTEKVQDSSVISKKLLASTNPEIRTQAKDLADAAAEYAVARPVMVLNPAGSMPWDQPYIFLKRSWLVPDDLKRSEEQLRNHNANIMLSPLRASEQRVLGTLTDVSCSNGINYTAVVNGKPMTFSSVSFDGVRLAVLIEGSRSFKLDCGVDLSKAPAVLTYVPAKGPTSKAKLTGISFVGDAFRLQTPAEVWGYRTVIIENDRLRKGPGDQIIYAGDLKEPERWDAISKDLRKPASGEIRVLASITQVACSQGSLTLTVAGTNGVFNLISRDTARVVVKWFTTENVDAPLLCGSIVSIPNVLVTYAPLGNAAGELKAIEFVPTGFSLPGPTEPSH